MLNCTEQIAENSTVVKLSFLLGMFFCFGERNEGRKEGTMGMRKKKIKREKVGPKNKQKKLKRRNEEIC
jgi:hypothetical protein